MWSYECVQCHSVLWLSYHICSSTVLNSAKYFKFRVLFSFLYRSFLTDELWKSHPVVTWLTATEIFWLLSPQSHPEHEPEAAGGWDGEFCLINVNSAVWSMNVCGRPSSKVLTPRRIKRMSLFVWELWKQRKAIIIVLVETTKYLILFNLEKPPVWFEFFSLELPQSFLIILNKIQVFSLSSELFNFSFWILVSEVQLSSVNSLCFYFWSESDRL